jgi:hypothetical protein
MEIAVHQKSLLCFLLFFGAGFSAEAGETKTYPEAQCQYTLPTDDWEWLDAQLAPKADAKSIVLVKNQNGMGFNLRYQPLAGEKPTANSFESFETGFIQAGKMKKLAGAKITFRGIPAYQIDAEMPGGNGISVRIMYANDNLYILQVINALGPLTAADSDAIFQGFDFTNLPQPMPMADSAFERGQAIGKGIVSLVIVGGVVLAVYFLIKKGRAKPNDGVRGG